MKRKVFFPERSVQHIDQVVQVLKSTIPKMGLKHVKKTLNPDDLITSSETRNKMQAIKRIKSNLC